VSGSGVGEVRRARCSWWRAAVRDYDGVSSRFRCERVEDLRSASRSIGRLAFGRG